MACTAMGTRFEIALWGDDQAGLRTRGEAAIEEIQRWHAQLSWFDPASFLSHVNARAHAEPVTCEPEFFALLALCQSVFRNSGGAFDPSIAPLMRAGGFRSEPRCEVARSSAFALTGFDQVVLDHTRRTVRYATPGVSLDFGAVGKGWALDMAASVLREAGVNRALLHGGTSSILALEPPPDEPDWKVALADGPVVRLRNRSLSVSAPHGRTVSDHAQTHGHVLDPRTGLSAQAASVAAVTGQSAALTDAWSTAALVLADRPSRLPPDYGCAIGLGVRDASGAAETLHWKMSGDLAATLMGSKVRHGEESHDRA